MSELFDVGKMEQSINKAKRRSTWKTVLITVTVLTIGGIVGVFLNRTVTPLMEQPIADSFHLFNQISGANEFISTMEAFPGLFGGEHHYKTYKLIEGKVVYTGEDGYGYGLFRNEWLGRIGMRSPIIFGGAYSEDNLEYVQYNVLGQRQMTFFYPLLSYEHAGNDLALLDEIGDDKVMEMALSFDQGYTSSEAMELIPKTVTKTWLWVNDVDEKDEIQAKSFNEDGEIIAKTNLLRNENTVFGFSILTPNGDKAEMPN